ncbi:MAG: tyrosine-protein phosphatase [Clostridia bacterium]|nr:tyrosine-protein phosphatase [Clostridia bacterium]
MKDGLLFEDGELIYYENDQPCHAGLIRVDDAIYYIGSEGRAVKGEHVVHRGMTHDILPHGRYTFGDDYKLIVGSYVAPIKRTKKVKRRSKRRKSSRKVSRKYVWSLVALAAAVVLIFGAVWLAETMSHPASVTAPDTTGRTVGLPSFDEEILLCSDAAKQVFDGDLSVADAIKTGDPYRAMTFSYRLNNADGVLTLSENEDLSDATTYVMSKKSTALTIDNLKTGTTYYYTVTVGDDVYPGSFHTAAANRFIKIPGIINTRDIGGYKTLDGKTVKQGLLIRGTELDGYGKGTNIYYLTDDAAKTMQDTFEFRYEMDLRSPTVSNVDYQSRLGADVRHDFYDSPSYGTIFNVSAEEPLRRIFADLAKPENYPMYMHCTYGADRTGTIIFLLQGVLNISEEDMQKEYQLTGFTHPDFATSTSYMAICSGLEKVEGNTLQEKIVNYLTNTVGVTAEEIAQIRAIYLTD